MRKAIYTYHWYVTLPVIKICKLKKWDIFFTYQNVQDLKDYQYPLLGKLRQFVDILIQAVWKAVWQYITKSLNRWNPVDPRFPLYPKEISEKYTKICMHGYYSQHCTCMHATPEGAEDSSPKVDWPHETDRRMGEDLSCPQSHLSPISSQHTLNP